MIIKRICLEDFGIFRNQILDNLHGGLVVIAGGNRAGKSTFMTALRYLGYGFPKRSSIPPSSGEQQVVSADTLLSTGERFNIKLEGYGAPKVFNLNTSKDTTVAEIFGGLDSYTYRQVFTISLDELRRIPEDPDNQSEQHLQAVLLGGGWTDALRLMQIRQEFGKNANAIAGKNGAKGTGQFKPFSQAIARGLELRDEANRQIEQYHSLAADIAFEKASLADLEKELRKVQTTHRLHELVRDHFDTYQQYVRLEEILGQEHNKDLLENYPPQGLLQSQRLLEDYSKAYRHHEFLLNRFQANIGTEKQEVLLENADTLELYAKEVSGWKEKNAALEANLKDHREAREEMAAELADLHCGWGKDLNTLNSLPLDLPKEEQLFQLVDDLHELEGLLKACTGEILQNRRTLEHKEEQAKAFIRQKTGTPKRLAFFSALGLALVLMAAVIFGSGAAVGTGLVAGAGILAYVLYNHLSSGASRREVIINQVEELRANLDVLEKQQHELQQAVRESQEELQSMLRTFHLPEDLPCSAVPDFVRGVKNLKKRFNSWLIKDRQLTKQWQEQQELLNRLQALLKKLGLAVEASPSNLFSAVDTAWSNLCAAQELKTSELGIRKLEWDIVRLLEEAKELPPEASFQSYIQGLQTLTDRGHLFEKLKQQQLTLATLETGLLQALNTPINRGLLNAPHYADTTELLHLFGTVCSAFSSQEEAAESCLQLAEKERSLKADIAQKTSRIPVMESKLAQLASEDKLLQAGKDIAEARQGLEFKAEEYALYRIAEKITEDLYKQLMSETKTKVLGTAGDFFEKITSGEYASISLQDEGEIKDFVACTSENNVAHSSEGHGNGSHRNLGMTTSVLSRGTREQLFLSLRLSRIKGISPPLPVILDDSLANFDPTHTWQAVRLVANLAKTHQVFVLTCHPELIAWIVETECPAQYWGLEKGVFTGPYAEPERVLDLLAAK